MVENAMKEALGTPIVQGEGRFRPISREKERKKGKELRSFDLEQERVSAAALAALCLLVVGGEARSPCAPAGPYRS
ncbi:MAG: hypothetical protein R3E03_01550 [Novosphingobium sp.]